MAMLCMAKGKSTAGREMRGMMLCGKASAAASQSVSLQECASAVCPICHMECGQLLVNEAWAGQWQSACGHGACEACVRRRVEAQISSCRERRQLRMQCFMWRESGCTKSMPQGLVLHISGAARQLAEKLERRFELENNDLYPKAFQVDCPRSECVGLGYLGFDTVMCFCCEHQWFARPDQLPKRGAHEEPTEAVKHCPRCAVPIEKDGGCDHMTCQCGYDFLWSTMEAWQP
mmetsp:Transcript_69571/g.148821  ORF Transcript_69571/g.148821 Transcript_69571/m.148821 type:complete len:232 (-) Transcript_69571:65-760(-)